MATACSSTWQFRLQAFTHPHLVQRPSYSGDLPVSMQAFFEHLSLRGKKTMKTSIHTWPSKARVRVWGLRLQHLNFELLRFKAFLLEGFTGSKASCPDHAATIVHVTDLHLQQTLLIQVAVKTTSYIKESLPQGRPFGFLKTLLPNASCKL